MAVSGETCDASEVEDASLSKPNYNTENSRVSLKLRTTMAYTDDESLLFSCNIFFTHKFTTDIGYNFEQMIRDKNTQTTVNGYNDTNP